LVEECGRLHAARDDAPPPPLARVKGAAQLDGGALAVAQGLAEWREGVARVADRPRNWILRDEVLLAIARRRPRDPGELAAVEGMPAATVRRYGPQLLALVEAPPAPVADQRPERPPRLSPAGTQLLGALQQRVRERAEAARVAPTLLATRRDLEQLIVAGRAPRLARGWRAEVVGRELHALRETRAGESLTLPG
jgi:ribonuclease D